MSLRLVDSPPLVYRQDGLPRERAGHERVWLRLMAALAVAMAVAVGGLAVAVQRLTPPDLGGTISGQVLTSDGTPIRGMLVFPMTRPDEIVRSQQDGTFRLGDLPAGASYVVVVTSSTSAQEFPVTVVDGAGVDVGALELATYSAGQ